MSVVWFGAGVVSALPMSLFLFLLVYVCSTGEEETGPIMLVGVGDILLLILLLSELFRAGTIRV